MNFGVGTFARSGHTFPGLVVEDRVVDLSYELQLHNGVRALLEDWDHAVDRCAALADRVGPTTGTAYAEVTPLPPIQPASQVWCAGANYYTHTVEMSEMLLASRGDGMTPDQIRDEAVAIADRVRAWGQPFVFAGQPSALCGAQDDVVLWGPGVEHDWELEIAVIIGTRAQHVSAEQAMSHVAGYTICNDVSTRDLMFRDGFALSDFNMSKNRPTFYPIGPYIVPERFVPDYRELELELELNGQTMQSGRADDIIYGIEELISYVSHLAVLEPGDVLLTGTPSGNAAAHGNRWLRPGDEMVGRVTGLGELRNQCVADPRHEFVAGA